MFINACFSCTGQREFYGDSRGQAVSIDFLHQYILGNYRRLYARTLAAGINHFNQTQIVFNLLASGREVVPADKADESDLINAALLALPPQRVYGLFERLRHQRVNNRRTRAVMRDYLTRRPDPAFDAVKYRNKVRSAAVHAHLGFEDERSRFLFGKGKQTPFETGLFESYRRAGFAKESIYALPFTVAQGFAARHRIPQETFLERIGEQMTAGEKLRLQRSAARHDVDSLSVDLKKAPLTKLALYLLSMTVEARSAEQARYRGALEAAAKRALPKGCAPLGRIAAVLDNSYSSSGSSEKRRRPLAVALGVGAILEQAAQAYRSFWTGHREADILVRPRGQTDLATPLVDALAWGAELVVIVSDGYENAPPGAVGKVVRAFRDRIDPQGNTAVIHVNPVFDAEAYAPQVLGESLPTVGLYNAEDLMTMLGFARFAAGFAPLEELESYLAARVSEFLNGPLEARGGGS